jgi:toxin CptA
MSSSTPFSGLLAIRPTPSARLAAFVAVAHAGAIIALCISGLSPWMKGLLVVVVMVSASQAARKWWITKALQREYTYFIGGDGTWFRQKSDGSTENLAVVPPIYVQPWLIVVRFRTGGPARSLVTLVLPPDSIDADTHRRLRVRLRFPLRA